MTTDESAAQADQSQDDFRVPGRVLLWRVLVKPMPPKKETKGGIILTDETLEAQQQRARVAQVVDMGDLAYAAETKAGLKFSKDRNIPQVGSYVLINEFSGQAINIKGQKYLVLNDTEILFHVSNIDDLQEYL